ncbi:MAG: hypothetical protein JXR97_01555 [Planctomycetes bacterium]|nr:hypothetical protein [Planctomycetota bacterium]
MRDSLSTRLILLLASIVCIYVGSTVMPNIIKKRDYYRLTSVPPRQGVPPEYILTSALLGGFRGMFITTLWIRAQNMKNDGKFYEMVDIYNIITKLQPNHHMAWAFQAWDLAYNVSVEFDETDERVFWVFRGIDLLRLQGIPNAPNIPELYYELSWIFHHKLGADLDYAHPLYRAKLYRDMEMILRGIQPEDTEHFTQIVLLRAKYPTREDFINSPEFKDITEALAKIDLDPLNDFEKLLTPKLIPEAAKELMKKEDSQKRIRQAGLWVIGEELQKKEGLSAEYMLSLMNKYGPIDWRTPYAHALYWGQRGYDVWKNNRNEKLTLKYERLVYFSLISLVKRGRPIITPNGQVHYVPDSRLFDAVVTHMDDMIKYFNTNKRPDGTTVSLTGVMSGYKNFLKDAVFSAYFEGRKRQATKLLAKLAEVAQEDKFRVPLSEFIVKNFAEYIDSPDIKTTIEFVRPKLQHAYEQLALGDIDGYRGETSLIEYFYKEYALKRWDETKRDNPKDPDYSGHLPALVDLRKDVVVNGFLSPESQYPDWIKQALVYRLNQFEPETMKMVEAEIRRLQGGPEDPLLKDAGK